MPARTWTENELASLIREAVEESLSLEYKAAMALSRSDSAKREITKDVSAMANSAGGVIVYGIREYDDPEHRHLPERVDPVNGLEYSREWLEQVINRIQPRIPGLVIHSIRLKESPAHCVYVVEIPAGETAHQAADFRYYRRFNFQAVPMADHEIRDIMGRRTQPAISLEFLVAVSPLSTWVEVAARNIGNLFASYINAFIDVPESMLLPKEVSSHPPISGYSEFSCDNTVRDVMDMRSLAGGGSMPIYGPARFDPLLPGLTRTLRSIPIQPLYFRLQDEAAELHWRVYADNAAPNEGSVRVLDIHRVERD